MTSHDNLPYVEAELNYLAPMAERPRYYAYDQPGVPRSNLAHEAHRVRIYDMRPVQSEISLDREGFALLEQRSAVRDFWDDDEIRRVYYPEAAQLIASATGRVACSSLITRCAAHPGCDRPLARRAAPAGDICARRPH